jgi:predicted trehalose synthase
VRSSNDAPLQRIDYDLHIGQVLRVVEALDR